ncbi:MAG TPA: hypothetical protein VGC66_09580 [Pyrinomonadaceae bacterium]|jgi:hypothetical protein
MDTKGGHDQDTPPPSDGEPIFAGLLVDNSWRGQPDHLFLQGNYYLEPGEDRPLKWLFFETARFMGEELPPHFIFYAGEIFYDSLRVEEVRLAGISMVGINNDGLADYVEWSTRVRPRFEVTEAQKIVLSDIDRGRTHVAAVKLESHLAVAFDVAANANLKFGRGVKAYIFPVSSPDASPQDAADQDQVRESYFSRAEKLLEDIPVESLEEYLLPQRPIEPGERKTLVIKDGTRRLIYSYDEEEMCYEFAMRYVKSVNLSEQSLIKFAKENNLSLARAKALTLFLHSKARDKFMSENIEGYRKRCERALQDTSWHLLKQEPIVTDLAEFESPGVVRELETREVKKILSWVSDRLTKGRIGVKVGRPLGSETKKEQEKLETENAEHKAAIIEAMQKVYQEAQAGNPKSNPEEAITRTAIGKNIGTPNTLRAWLKNGNFDFESLKTEALRALNRN